MYYNDYNRPQEPWDHPVETTGRTLEDTTPSQPPKKKKKGLGAGLVALCLVGALVGGAVGGAGVTMALNRGGGGSTTLYEGERAPTVVNVANVSTKSPLTGAQIYNTYVGSTVGITTQVTTNVFGQPVSAAAAGSGFVISDDGYIITNYHVIDQATSIKVSFSNGDSYDAKLVGGESENDIAVLKIEATGLTPVLLGDSDNLQVGEQAVAIGNPLGELTFSISAKDRSITMSDGTVMNMLQTNMAINAGNSGGPMFDMYGQVVGIISAKLSSSSSSSSEASIEGLGFAIPINDVKDMVQSIIENGYVTGKPYMGITVTTIPESVAKQYGLTQGALVRSVDPSSCAAAAGLQENDVITAHNGKSVLSSAELIEAKKECKAGDTVTLTVNRNGEELTLTLTYDEDTPQRQATQQAELEKKNQEQQQQQQQSQSDSYGWPFGGFSPWFY